MKTDLSLFRKKAEAVRRTAPAIAQGAVMDMASQAMRTMVQIAPRDTGHYARAWAQAHNTLPSGETVAVPAIKPSKYAGYQRARLDKQIKLLAKWIEESERVLKYWQDILAKRYDEKGRRGKWRTVTVREVQGARKRLDKLTAAINRAIEQKVLYDRSGETAIVIGGRRLKPGQNFGKQHLATVRVGEYGGDAKLVSDGDRVYVVGHNKEPHASIVETKRRVVARANELAGLKFRGGHAARAIGKQLRQLSGE